MMFEFNDGGRADAGFKGFAGDCGVRALAIVTGQPYADIYQMAKEFGLRERMTAKRRAKGRSHPRTGIWRETFDKMAAEFGLVWTPAMSIGTGCKVHVAASELPAGRMVLRLSRHYAAFVDGVLMDTHDSSRGGTRCVYGWWS